MSAYTGKVVFITGGTSGLGLAAARAFAGRGADIAVFSSSAQTAEMPMQEIGRARQLP